MYDKIAEASLLYDFYSHLLTEKQKEVLHLYHEENYSLSEIAEEFSISRQGVHDALKNGEKALREYEEKLGLVRRFARMEKDVKDICDKIEALICENAHREDLVLKLTDIKNTIGGLGQYPEGQDGI